MTQVAWHPHDAPPPKDQLVLIHDPQDRFEPVGLGYWDGYEWKLPDGMWFEPAHWAEIPPAPAGKPVNLTQEQA